MTDYFERITHCTFTCKDYSAMKRFYGEVLGLPKLFYINFDELTIEKFRGRGYQGEMRAGDEWLSYFKVAEKEFIELFHVPYNGDNEVENQGFHHVCLLVRDIGEARETLLERGARLLDVSEHSLRLQDPEGNLIELRQDETEKVL